MIITTFLGFFFFRFSTEVRGEEISEEFFLLKLLVGKQQ